MFASKSIERARLLHGASAFTLIELIVAITLMALMVGILYGAFYLGHRSVDKARVRFESNRALRAVDDILGSLVRSAYPYRPENSQGVLFSGDRETLTFVSAISTGVGGRGLSKISLSRTPGEPGELTLEEEVPARGAGYRNALVLWTGLIGLTIEYLEPRRLNEQWVGEWDGKRKRELPRAVRMMLWDASGTERRWVFPIMMKVLAPS